MIVLHADDQCTIYKLTTAELERQLHSPLYRDRDLYLDLCRGRKEYIEETYRDHASHYKGCRIPDVVWREVVSTSGGVIISDPANLISATNSHPKTTIYWVDYHVAPRELYTLSDVLHVN
jgi:hypothetical protein